MCLYFEMSHQSLYVGCTGDIERRLKEHHSNRGGHHTQSFGPVTFLWKESHPDKFSALKREAQIKGWTRRKKLALIKGDFALLKKL